MRGIADQTRKRQTSSSPKTALWITVIAAIAILLVTGCSASTTSSSPTTTSAAPTTAAATKPAASPVATTKAFANADLLVESDWLASNLTDTNLRIVDVRKADDYNKGHIKGAINIPVDSTYGSEGPQALPPAADKIAQLLGPKGIGNDNRVVIYAAGQDYNASRFFWALEYYGHKKASILNGGFTKWQKEGRETATTAQAITATTFTAKINPTALSTKDDLLASTNNPNASIIDSRAPAEYTGAEPNAKRGGHVPKAVNVDWVNLFNTDGTFKSPDDLAGVYSDKGITKDKKEFTSYCQVGLRSAATYFSLRLLGYDNVRHYVPSWSEWGNDTNLPIEK